MRITSAASIAIVGSVMSSLVGCSAAQSQGYGLFGEGVTQIERVSANDARSGRSARFLTLSRFSKFTMSNLKLAKDRRLRDLYVSDFTKVALLKNGSYKQTGTLTKGLVSPDGDFVDAAGNFYVADYDGVDVQEYKPGGKSPWFTYKHGMIDPVDVSVDSHGNVYEADYDGWYVKEYAQRSNRVINSCSPGGGVQGVAVDANNDVFVDYNKGTFGSGRIAEYKSGLAGCRKIVFKVSLEFAGGMVLDAKGNLIVVDQNAPAVDIIAPPYSSITGTLGSGFYIAPFHVTLDKKNNLAFVADLYDVFVVDYPSGSLAASLGGGNGFGAPAGAVDDPNAVY
jgi:hypothetical protein